MAIAKIIAFLMKEKGGQIAGPDEEDPRSGRGRQGQGMSDEDREHLDTGGGGPSVSY